MHINRDVLFCRADFQLYQDQKAVAERELEEGKQALISMREALVKMNESDKALEKNFKKEFPDMNYNQLEALMKLYR